MTWSLNDAADQTGNTILVAGVNTRVGFATAHLLSSKGASVIIACRDLEKGKQASTLLHTEFPHANMETVKLDLAELNAIKLCVSEVVEIPKSECCNQQRCRDDGTFSKTKDGFEIQLGTNVLRCFALAKAILVSKLLS